MQATGWTGEQLSQAAEAVNVVLFKVRNLYGKRAPRYRFRILPVRTSRKRGERAQWQRQSTAGMTWGPERAVWAVCWHGHREFMRELFKANPDGIIRTAKATYQGSEHFESTHRTTAYANIGSIAFPVGMAEACYC